MVTPLPMVNVKSGKSLASVTEGVINLSLVIAVTLVLLSLMSPGDIGSKQIFPLATSVYPFFRVAPEAMDQDPMESAEVSMDIQSPLSILGAEEFNPKRVSDPVIFLVIKSSSVLAFGLESVLVIKSNINILSFNWRAGK